MNRNVVSARLRVRRRNPALELKGTLRAPVSAGLRHRVAVLLSRGQRRIVLDVRGLSDIDAAGVGELVRIFNMTAAAGGTLRIVCPQKWVRELLRVAGLLTRLAPPVEAFPAAKLRLLDEAGIYPLDCRPGEARG